MCVHNASVRLGFQRTKVRASYENTLSFVRGGHWCQVGVCVGAFDVSSKCSESSVICTTHRFDIFRTDGRHRRCGGY